MITNDVLAIATIGLLVLLLQRAASGVQTYRRIRVVACPGSGRAAAVQLSAWHAAMSGLLHRRELRVTSCSEWPARHGCERGCTKQIAAAPADSLVPHILARWCEGKSCICCGTPLRHVHVNGHQPFFMTPERKVLAWSDVAPQDLPDTLNSCGPVCWTCLMAETHTW